MGYVLRLNIFGRVLGTTTGGLDSLPGNLRANIKSPRKKAPVHLERTTSFFTTGTRNRTEMVRAWALLATGDIIVVDPAILPQVAPYGRRLSGALPLYVEAYPLHSNSHYGAVTYGQSKKALLRFEREGKNSLASFGAHKLHLCWALSITRKGHGKNAWQSSPT